MDADRQATLTEAVRDYLRGIQKAKLRQSEARILLHLEGFASEANLSLREVFTLDGLNDFRRRAGMSYRSLSTVVRLSEHVFQQGEIDQPLTLATYQHRLPQVYEDFLVWLQTERHFPAQRCRQTRRVLTAFHLYLNRTDTELTCLRMDQVDGFLATFRSRYAPNSCRNYGTMLKHFLGYLYHERSIIGRDLASFVRFPRINIHPKPHKFLRPVEVHRLFASLSLSSPVRIRASAIIHLAYMLGLRPSEIRRLALDDVFLSKGEIVLLERKNETPVRLPLPEQVVKVLAAYLVGVRGNSELRNFFLTLSSPFRPLSMSSISTTIKECMRQAGVKGSPYWLRHTYAQNLLEAGTSVFEIRDMLGHTSIDSTRQYLRIHIKLMRELVLDETL